MVPIGSASCEPRNGPNRPPLLIPAAMKPNSRPACSRLNTSAIRLQNTATTNSTKMLTQTKYARAIQVWSAWALNQAWKPRMFSTKNRYTHGRKAERRKREVSQPYTGCTSSMPANVPQNSAGSVCTPEVMPIVSRIGRRIA